MRISQIKQEADNTYECIRSLAEFLVPDTVLENIASVVELEDIQDPKLLEARLKDAKQQFAAAIFLVAQKLKMVSITAYQLELRAREPAVPIPQPYIVAREIMRENRDPILVALQEWFKVSKDKEYITEAPAPLTVDDSMPVDPSALYREQASVTTDMLRTRYMREQYAAIEKLNERYDGDFTSSFIKLTKSYLHDIVSQWDKGITEIHTEAREDGLIDVYASPTTISHLIMKYGDDLTKSGGAGMTAVLIRTLTRALAIKIDGTDVFDDDKLELFYSHWVNDASNAFLICRVEPYQRETVVKRIRAINATTITITERGPELLTKFNTAMATFINRLKEAQ